eukprot:scaffold12806_cov69-Skeletonema_menzelii.AAC.2
MPHHTNLENDMTNTAILPSDSATSHSLIVCQACILEATRSTLYLAQIVGMQISSAQTNLNPSRVATSTYLT